MSHHTDSRQLPCFWTLVHPTLSSLPFLLPNLHSYGRLSIILPSSRKSSLIAPSSRNCPPPRPLRLLSENPKAKNTGSGVRQIWGSYIVSLCCLSFTIHKMRILTIPCS